MSFIGLKKSNNKIFQIKTTVWQKVGRFIFWTFFIFLIFRGIGTLFPSNEAQDAAERIQSFEEKTSYKQKLEFQGKSYAENFAFEFMTFNPKKIDDYKERIGKFLPAYLEEMGSNSDSVVSTEVLSAKAYEVEWISEKQFNVSVWMKVGYEPEQANEDENLSDGKEEKEKTIGIKVPIAYSNGRYVVEDYPAFIAIPEKADVNFQAYTGYNAETYETKEITEVLNNFFKVYYSGSPSEISYYMENSKEIKGLEDSFKYTRLGNISVFVEKNNESSKKKYIALAEVYIIDSDSQMEMKQKYHVKLTNDGKRYYISSFDVRTCNLSN